jgi:ATP-binding cassette subfamily B protein/subfamily B ATP-binding cassette protein MsbA
MKKGDDKRAHSSRQRYREFMEDYRARRLDAIADSATAGTNADSADAANTADRPLQARALFGGKRREYLREYFRWLRPHGGAVGVVFVLALSVAGLEMIEPLFMRHIIDRVLMNQDLDAVARLRSLHLTGTLFLAVILVSNLLGVLKDYRQKLLNTQVMLSLRRSLFDRMLNLPLPKLWDMKTGGILSRITGDIDTTTGLLQMAIVSPALSIVRLAIAFVILLTLNWRLALMAMAVIPGAMIISFGAARRVRPIYRAVRRDVEVIDGRVGETFSGIRVVRAFRQEVGELLGFLRGRHTVLRKELFAHRGK